MSYILSFTCSLFVWICEGAGDILISGHCVAGVMSALWSGESHAHIFIANVEISGISRSVTRMVDRGTVKEPWM